jgi:hypothetical protein
MHVLPSATQPSRPDAGQALPLLLVLVALMAVVAISTARLGNRVLVIERAQTAADAAALAGVSGGASEAAAIAVRNGGRLVRFEWRGDDVVVAVRVGDHTARARASRAP